MTRRILLATANAHKAFEIRAIIAALLPQDTEIVCLADIGIGAPPDDVERFETFAENATAKAVWCRDRSGIACLADDSGLCIDALGGAPGVRSARWAGPTDADRNDALLAELDRVGAHEPEQRRARFVCAAALAPVAGETVVEIGETHGRIQPVAAGGSGFGYDPLFFCPEIGATFAEAGPDAKNAVSHRSRAFRLLFSKYACFVP